MKPETRSAVIDYLCIGALAASFGLTIFNIVKAVKS